MNIVLIGMRGSGKTTVAKLLAEKLHKSFYDFDARLEETEKMPIAMVVKKHGWEYFRDKESEIVQEISEQTDAVISTGGGVILRKNNIDALSKNGIFVFLKTTVATMIKRIEENSNRPPLTKEKTLEEELDKILNERKPIYEQTANIIIKTDRKSTRLNS